RARAKLEYSPLGTAFCPPRFTVAQLRAVYEAVWGHPIDPRNFHRKVTSVPGLLVETDELRVEGRGRPAAVYRPGPATVIRPPLVRE
ncbi:MAG: NUDIX hydrolase, partial [Cellulomonas sp.]|nr:NUDIX hydrolase [Cellulomonas sp.]MCG2803737.1 NUDIX hydrolase [Cellulomonas sp.]